MSKFTVLRFKSISLFPRFSNNSRSSAKISSLEIHNPPQLRSRCTITPVTSDAASTMACRQCNNDPCSLTISRQMLDGVASTCERDMQPSASRHYLYCAFPRSEYGYLGAGNRIIIPECVRDYIRSLFPDRDGNYTGHRDANLGESSGLLSGNYYMFYCCTLSNFQHLF